MTALPQRDNTTEPDATRDARPDALAEDLTTARRSLITKLVTPGSTAPDSSLAVPEMEPVAWAWARLGASPRAQPRAKASPARREN